jgi:uncharacterized protein YgiM (DUF1202 family)
VDGRIKLRKGRCSNDPQNCTLAAAKTELPYAGIDSICPECNAPLAALAVHSASQTATATPVPPAYQPPPPPPPPVARPVDAHEAAPNYEDSGRRSGYDYESETRAPSNGAMKLTQMVLLGAAVALVGFFGWKMFLQPRQVEVPDISATQNGASSNTQVTQISPPQMRKANVTAEARTIPDASSAIMATLSAGTLLDVTGQVTVNGISWLRVSLPNDSSKSGFVREDQLAPLGDGGLNVTPVDPLAPSVVPGSTPATQTTAAAEAMGPIQPMATPVKYYVATGTANVRQDASANSARVASLTFNSEVNAVAQRTVGGKIWYQVQLPTGGSGWMNARLLSGDPRESPLDATATPPTPKLEKIEPKPVPPSDSPTTEVGKRDNQEALSAYGPGTTLRVDAPTANLRKEPGATGNTVVEALGRDTLMSVEDVRIVNGVPWYRVTSPTGAQGWVSGRTVVENR